MGAARFGVVALVGWTNVGKSTLLNRLVGRKIASVAECSQTTRHRICGVRTIPGMGQVALVDTPGFHVARHALNRAMLETALHALDGVDLAVLVLDAVRGLGDGDRRVARRLVSSVPCTVAALNKVDRVERKEDLLPLMRTVVDDWGAAEVVPISALTGEGCDVLLRRVLARLPEGDPMFPDDYLTDQVERQRVAESIREKVLHHTRQEIPHATAVTIDRWETRPDGLVHIEASVLVERESQKAIVIGSKGSLLKRVGEQARREIESWLSARVFLRLWVRVRPGWRDDERALRELGIR